MQKRQLQSPHLRFKSPEGERKPGVQPTKYRALVLPDEVNDLTEGGIAIPGQSANKAENGQTEGEFISAGGKAFNDWNPDEVPKTGQRVVFERYAGQMLTGEDGLEYRLMNDDQIVGVR
jgi:chaperonin GroES